MSVLSAIRNPHFCNALEFVEKGAEVYAKA